MIYFYKFDCWDVPLALFVLTDGERDGLLYCSLPFPGTGCPVPDVANIYLIWNI